MVQVIVYSTKKCPNCKILKDILKSKDIQFNEMNMENPAILTELSLKGVFTMVAPILQINDTFYHKEIINNGKLNVKSVNDILKQSE